jgi:hypothetical protein
LAARLGPCSTSARRGDQAMLDAARRDEFDVIEAEDLKRLWRAQAEQWRCGFHNGSTCSNGMRFRIAEIEKAVLENLELDCLSPEALNRSSGRPPRTPNHNPF